MSVKFYNIRQFACEHFYAWDDGEDFLWLKKEWPKFDSYFDSVAGAEGFILSLSSIYDEFSFEAYFARHNEEIEPDAISSEELIKKEKTEKHLDRTLDILLEVYRSQQEVYREFTTIKINWQLPHNDAANYIFDLLQPKFDNRSKKYENNQDSSF